MTASKPMHSYRFEGKFVREFSCDKEAFNHACGWYDERDASIEKWIDNGWRPAADPIYQPRFFYGNDDGGWIVENKLVEFDY